MPQGQRSRGPGSPCWQDSTRPGAAAGLRSRYTFFAFAVKRSGNRPMRTRMRYSFTTASNSFNSRRRSLNAGGAPPSAKVSTATSRIRRPAPEAATIGQRRPGEQRALPRAPGPGGQGEQTAAVGRVADPVSTWSAAGWRSVPELVRARWSRRSRRPNPCCSPGRPRHTPTIRSRAARQRARERDTGDAAIDGSRFPFSIVRPNGCGAARPELWIPTGMITGSADALRIVASCRQNRRVLSGSAVELMVIGVIPALASCCHAGDLHTAADELAAAQDLAGQPRRIANGSMPLDRSPLAPVSLTCGSTRSRNPRREHEKYGIVPQPSPCFADRLEYQSFQA